MVDILNSKWSEMDAGNDGASPDGIQGGYAPSTVAPTMRSSRGANKRQAVQHNAFYTSTGSANAYVLTYAQAPEQIFKGQKFAFFANHTNTGAATLNINSLGAKAIVQNDTIAALKAGQIISGMAVIVYYDGTRFRLISSSKADPDFTGTVTASLFSGSGASLTNLNASNLASGTVPNARISGAYDGFTFSTTSGKFTGSNWTGALTVEGTAPSIYFKQTDTGPSAFAGVNGGAFYILNDADSDGVYELPPYPFMMNLDGSGMTYGGSTVWTAGNDGTGSGLDADTVDGVHAASFVQTSRTVTAGNGLSGGGALSGNITLTMGTPGSISSSSTNSVTTTSHTHELVLASGDITTALGYTPANSGISVVAGNGLAGGGTLGASRTLTLGTPGDITNSTTNSVSATSHTHALGFVAAEVYTGSSVNNVSFPIGHTILGYTSNSPSRNAANVPYLDVSNTKQYVDSGHPNKGTALSGTYRNHGVGSGGFYLMQRTA